MFEDVNRSGMPYLGHASEVDPAHLQMPAGDLSTVQALLHCFVVLGERTTYSECGTQGTVETRLYRPLMSVSPGVLLDAVAELQHSSARYGVVAHLPPTLPRPAHRRPFE